MGVSMSYLHTMFENITIKRSLFPYCICTKNILPIQKRRHIVNVIIIFILVLFFPVFIQGVCWKTAFGEKK